jgi:hypothetical protein
VAGLVGRREPGVAYHTASPIAHKLRHGLNADRSPPSHALFDADETFIAGRGDPTSHACSTAGQIGAGSRCQRKGAGAEEPERVHDHAVGCAPFCRQAPSRQPSRLKRDYSVPASATRRSMHARCSGSESAGQPPCAQTPASFGRTTAALDALISPRPASDGSTVAAVAPRGQAWCGSSRWARDPEAHLQT